MRPGWFEELYSYDKGAQEGTAPVVTVNVSNSRMGRLSAGQSVLASNDGGKADVFVLSENEIAIELYTGKEGKTPVQGVEVTLRDVRDPYGPEIKRTTDRNGRILLLPGALASFTGTLKIPAGWSGEKTLYLRVASASTYTNWVGTMANAAGAKPDGVAANAAAPEELTWVLDGSEGTMVLQTGNLASNGAAANAIRSGLIADAVKAAEPIVLNTADQDIEIEHRVYGDGAGNDMLDIIISNYAGTQDQFRLTCAVYLDQEQEPCYVNLPYYGGALADRRTHTISLPVSTLVNDPDDHYQARVVISAMDRRESAITNNEFTLFLGGGGLHVTRQPVSRTVQEGEDVTFEAEAGGGAKPYSYQWQVWDRKHRKWVDLPGFTGSTLSRKDIEKKWDGCKFRCVITDAQGEQVITDEIVLTVRDRVPTGDGSHLPLYLSVVLAALMLLWIVRRRMRRE